MQQSDTKGILVEITPERREKLERVIGHLIDFLRVNTQGPAEAYMVMKFVMESLEKTCGIRGGFAISTDDEKH